MSISLSEQISRMRPAMARGRPEVRIVVQVTAQLAGDSPHDAAAEARQRLLTWLEEKQGIRAIPDSAWNGAAFEIDSTESRPVTVDALGPLWGMRYENPDGEVAGRTWRTEAIVGHSEEEALVGLRLTVITREWDVPYFKSVPNVVRELVARPGLRDYGVTLSDEPTSIRNEGDVDRLVDLLESQSRIRPVFVVTESESGAFLIDPEWLAQRTAGIAHVVTLTSRAAWLLSDAVGGGLSVYGGSVRTYNPGFDRYSARFNEHPLATSDWLERRFEDARSFAGMLVRHAIDLSTQLPDLDERLPNFSAFRRTAGQKRLQDARAADKSQEELIELLEADIRNLQSELEAAEQLALESEEKANLFRIGQDELESVVFGLKQRIDGLKTALVASERTEEIEFPADLSEVDQWVPKYLGDTLYLLGRALRGARKSVFEDTRLVYQALLLLGGAYARNRRGEISIQELQEDCQKLGIEISPTGEQATLLQWRDQYEVTWKKQKRFLDMHLKKGKAHDPRHSLRIYFFWDDELEQVVVGHMTDHLQSTHS